MRMQSHSFREWQRSKRAPRCRAASSPPQAMRGDAGCSMRSPSLPAEAMHSHAESAELLAGARGRSGSSPGLRFCVQSVGLWAAEGGRCRPEQLESALARAETRGGGRGAERPTARSHDATSPRFSWDCASSATERSGSAQGARSSVVPFRSPPSGSALGWRRGHCAASLRFAGRDQHICWSSFALQSRICVKRHDSHREFLDGDRYERESGLPRLGRGSG